LRCIRPAVNMPPSTVKAVIVEAPTANLWFIPHPPRSPFSSPTSTSLPTPTPLERLQRAGWLGYGRHNGADPRDLPAGTGQEAWIGSARFEESEAWVLPSALEGARHGAARQWHSGGGGLGGSLSLAAFRSEGLKKRAAVEGGRWCWCGGAQDVRSWRGTAAVGMAAVEARRRRFGTRR
jgi:hypothetical protein